MGIKLCSKDDVCKGVSMYVFELQRSKLLCPSSSLMAVLSSNTYLLARKRALCLVLLSQPVVFYESESTITEGGGGVSPWDACEGTCDANFTHQFVLSSCV